MRRVSLGTAVSDTWVGHGDDQDTYLIYVLEGVPQGRTAFWRMRETHGDGNTRGRYLVPDEDTPGHVEGCRKMRRLAREMAKRKNAIHLSEIMPDAPVSAGDLLHLLGKTSLV